MASFSEVVDHIQNDRAVGLKYIFDAVRSHRDAEEKVRSLEQELDSANADKAGLTNAVEYAIQLLEIKPPFSIKMGNEVIMINTPRKFTISRLDYDLEVVSEENLQADE